MGLLTLCPGLQFTWATAALPGFDSLITRVITASLQSVHRCEVTQSLTWFSSEVAISGTLPRLKP